jgi:hypothetical protein
MSDEEELGPTSDAMRSLLKRSLQKPEPEREQSADNEILRGVQRKIRKRSDGKFYGDGWSTTQSRIGYGAAACTFLVILLLAYAGMNSGFFGK